VSKAQRRCLEYVAQHERTGPAAWPTVRALLSAGLIEQTGSHHDRWTVFHYGLTAAGREALTAAQRTGSEQVRHCGKGCGV
jgi:hypothetical protein